MASQDCVLASQRSQEAFKLDPACRLKAFTCSTSQEVHGDRQTLILLAVLHDVLRLAFGFMLISKPTSPGTIVSLMLSAVVLGMSGCNGSCRTSAAVSLRLIRCSASQPSLLSKKCLASQYLLGNRSESAATPCQHPELRFCLMPTAVHCR